MSWTHYATNEHYELHSHTNPTFNEVEGEKLLFSYSLTFPTPGAGSISIEIQGAPCIGKLLILSLQSLTEDLLPHQITVTSQI